MPTEQPPPPQRGWKGSAPTAGAPGKGGPAWKGSASQTAVAKQPWSRKSKLIFGVGLLGVLAGLFVIIVLLLRPVKPFHLVLLSAGYETNLAIPHNVPGRKTVAKLAAWARGNDKVGVTQADLTSDPKALDDLLKEAKAQTVVLFLSAHGAADDEGPYLIPQDGGRRVRLTQILNRLDALPAGTKKLLILDATQVAASWPLGLFHNDFARQLEELKPRIEKTEGLVVLSASDQDQRSWVSEEWRQTIFAHHVQEGLRGAADNGSRRISAYDLYQYVRDKVKRWARNNREALQEPVLLGGEDRARGLELLAVEHPYEAPDPLEIEPFRVPGELTQAWADAHKLATLPAPSPAVYTPHLWRRYLATLLRYEQLVRAADRDSADKVYADLIPLHKRIVEARARKLDSALGTLAMPAALGWSALAGDDDRKAKDIQELWDKGDGQDALKEQLGKWVAAGKDDLHKRLLRVRLHGLLLRRAAANPEADLKTVQALLTTPEESILLRPAESQYLVLLARDLVAQPPQPLWPAVKDALDVRRVAEEAALGQRTDAKAATALPPYSEELLPWLRAEVEDGDKERRPGQDLLLASRPEDWATASAMLGKARKHYRKAQDLALTLRAALRERDEALAALPYYSQWAARERFRDQAQQDAFGRQVANQVKLWEKVQLLDNLLRTPNADAIDKLPSLTKDVADRMAALKKDVTARYLKANYPILQANWHELDSLLALPFPSVPAERRVALLAKLREISEKFNREADDKAGGQGAMTAEEARVLNRERARAEGKLALLALGEDAFKGLKGAVEYDEVKQAIWSSPNEVWKPALNRAGDEVAGRWGQLPAAVDTKLTQARRLDLDQARPLVRAAATLARRLPGSARAGDPDATDEQRRLQLYDLLCWQAGRTSLDFLAAEDPGQAAYYRTAGIIYVADARGQLAGEEQLPAKLKEARLARANQLKQELEDDNRKLAVAWSLDGRTFSSPKDVWLTDEDVVPLWYGVRATATVPPGHPVLWREFKGGQAFLKQPGEAARQVQPGVGAGPEKSAVEYPLLRKPRDASPPVPEEATQLVRGLYRGHRLVGATHIKHFSVPDLASSLPMMPPIGRLAVQAPPEVYARYAEGTGAVVLVLDCSGSMNEKVAGGRTRFDEARRALIEVLNGIPKRTQVSVWAFAHKFDIETGANMENDQPEKTIQRAYFAKSWDPTLANLDLVAKRINWLTPSGATPIIRSMVKASEDFTAKHRFKTLVMLTDGMDNRFERQTTYKWNGDKDYNPDGNLTIPQFLADYFGKKDIAIRFIGFQLPTKNEFGVNEQEIVTGQFKKPLETLPTKGKFYLVEDTEALIEKLRGSLKQRLYFALEKSTGEPVKGKKGVKDISKVGDDSHWVDLDPGIYQLVIEASNKEPLRQKVKIDRGDRLRLTLYEKGDGFALERDLVRESFPGQALREAEANGWRLTVLQNQRQLREDALQMTVTAEKLQGREFASAGTLGHPAPSLLLFQVRPKDLPKVRTPTLRSYPLADLTAPSWGLDIKPWGGVGFEPKGRLTPPVLEAFWSEDPPEVAGTLRRGRHFDDDLQILPEGATVPVQLSKSERDSVSLVSIRVEKHWVDTYDRKREEVSCVVVRLSFPKGKPVLAQLPGFSGGQEHRFYSQAGKYTGLFWEMSPEEARQRVQSLNLISLEGFREAAIATGQRARIELGPPSTKERPRPPQ